MTDTALKRRNKRRLGGWLPLNEKVIESFHLAFSEHLKSDRKTMHPEVEKLRNMIKNDPVLRMDFTMAIEQAQILPIWRFYLLLIISTQCYQSFYSKGTY